MLLGRSEILVIFSLKLGYYYKKRFERERKSAYTKSRENVYELQYMHGKFLIACGIWFHLHNFIFITCFWEVIV